MFNNRLIVYCCMIALFFLLGNTTAFRYTNVQTFKGLKQDVCCLPNVVSMQSVMNQYHSDSNGIAQLSKARISFNTNFNLGKGRVDYSYEIGGQASNLTRWGFKVNEETSVVYESTDNQNCRCYKSKNDDEWRIPCVTKLPNDKATKGKVGFYDALNIITASNGTESQNWVFREPHMSSDKCWFLSNSEISPTIISNTQYFNMVEKIDNTLFMLPSNCLPMEQCLKLNQ